MAFRACFKVAPLLLALLGAPSAWAEDVIKIGEVNSYKSQPVFTDGYKKGMQLAIDQINAQGGVAGKKLELLTRDDNANPGDAIRQVEDLINREHVDVLAGAFYANIGTALADYAKQKKRFVLVTEALSDNIVWSAGNRYTYRLDASTYMLTAALVDEAVRLHKKRWALVYPNYEFGTAAASAFKTLLKARQPDVEFVTEQAPPFGKVDAGSLVQALVDAKPDALFNALFGADLAKFVREGTTRELFGEQLPVLSIITGQPEYLEPLKDEIPPNWTVTGYPWYSIDTPAHKAFVAAYQAKYGKENLRFGSIIGYAAVQSIAAGIEAAGGKTDSESLANAFAGLNLTTPDGPLQFRASDHQATWGLYVGKLAVQDGAGVMVDTQYKPGLGLLPSDDEVRKLRPAE
ncbi:ABC transporter substrate-binding protein [Pseudomonas typographi]|uniref:ABC transporter substrate-binding protein n=1 Tax=Pseudomonas typographi TaxID=2715964 RepID=A0ABR7Z461_9PSED|nr:ABC transporter substrate-binding protein [Pseudomonas typographi]MBD1552686.1 ABC transporter substrate-binding protein [Pseudomonas typographi]MBD1600138.1 ABC transporter substrate-binding protein [Pseudomonas typographi]